MASSEPHRRLGRSLLARVALFIVWSSLANAQQQAPGFAVERLYLSAPGGGWFVMDDLDIRGKLGGALSVTSSYAHNPLVIAGPGGNQHLAVVSQEAFLEIGAAVSYNRFRGYLNLPLPFLLTGTSGALGQYQYTAPSVSLGTDPDTVSDTTLGLDVRIYGSPENSVRLGVGAQAIIPSGVRSDYVTDGRYGGMFRFLVAGGSSAFTYAGQLGVHIRPLNDAPVPGSPIGNEFLFGVSGGRRFTGLNDWSLVVGPEFFGQTAFHEFFSGATGSEGLLTTRFERIGPGRNLRIKFGIGHALEQDFGTPQWRIVAGVEIFGHK